MPTAVADAIQCCVQTGYRKTPCTGHGWCCSEDLCADIFMSDIRKEAQKTQEALLLCVLKHFPFRLAELPNVFCLPPWIMSDRLAETCGEGRGVLSRGVTQTFYFLTSTCEVCSADLKPLVYDGHLGRAQAKSHSG